MSETTGGKEEYFGIVREKKKWVRPCAVIVGLFMIYYGLTTKMYLAIPLGILLIMATVFRKELVASEKGVEIRYHVKLYDHIDCWTWDQVTTVHREDKGAPDVMAVHFGKDVLTRTFFFTRSDSEKVMALARRMNPSAQVVDMPKEEPVPARPKKKK